MPADMYSAYNTPAGVLMLLTYAIGKFCVPNWAMGQHLHGVHRGEVHHEVQTAIHQ